MNLYIVYRDYRGNTGVYCMLHFFVSVIRNLFVCAKIAQDVQYCYCNLQSIHVCLLVHVCCPCVSRSQTCMSLCRHVASMHCIYYSLSFLNVRNYPTQATVARKLAIQREKEERGEVLPTRLHRYQSMEGGDS